jgi:hypothetical protein
MRVYGSRYSASAMLKGKNLPLRRHEPYYEIHKDLEPSPNPITTEAGAHVLFRIEGHCDEPAPFEIAADLGDRHDHHDNDHSRLADAAQ